MIEKIHWRFCVGQLVTYLKQLYIEVEDLNWKKYIDKF